VSLVDPECAGIVRAFLGRTPRRPPASASSSRDPMFRRAGSSFDLKNIREYGPSDDPRRIDWKLMGRTDRLYVKEFFDEERDGACLLFDLSASISVFGFEGARALAASIAWILGALGIPTSLWAFSRRIERRLDRPRGGRSSAPIATFFEGLLAAGETDIPGALEAARRASRYRKAIVVSDFLDPSFDPRGSPFARSFFLRLHRDFEELGPGRGEVEVLDPETGARLRTPWDAPARERYVGRCRELDAVFGEATRRGSYYNLLGPSSDRGVAYWSLLEALYE
jgi:uncharacterized protein (DUF58 family)